MKPSTRKTGLAVTLAILSTATIASATSGDGAFRLMSEQEIADHAAAMATLEGAARDDYRNSQYRALRARAMEQGYSMPETPPWAAGATAAAGQPDPLAQHQAMRERLQAHRDQAGSAALVAPAAPVDRAAAGLAPAPASATATTKIPRTPADTAVTAPPQAPAPAPGPTRSVATDTPAGEAATAAPGTQPAAVQAAAVAAEPATAPTEPAQAAATAGPAAAATDTAAAPAQQRPPATAAGIGNEAMSAYRESMRARFDEYMRERQEQFEENIRRHREQREVTLEQPPARVTPPTPPGPPRMQPYAYPPAPAYGPRYPSGFPGYRTPYWQQNP